MSSISAEDADPEETERQTQLSGAAWLILAPLALNLLSIVSSAYIIRKLGGEGWGTWVTAQALVGSGTFLTNLGLRGIFVRTLAIEPARAQQLLAEQLTLRLALGTVAVALAVGVSLALGYPGGVLQCVLVAGGTALVTVVWTTLGDFLHAFQRFRAFAIINVAAGLLLTIASVIAAALNTGPVGIAIAYATGPIATAIIMEVALRRTGYRFGLTWNPARFKALFSASKALAGQQFVGSMQGRISSLLLPKLVGIPSYGHLSAAGMPADRLALVPDALASSFFPSLAKRSGSERRTEFGNEAGRFIRLLLVGTILPAIGCIVLSRQIALILVPEHLRLGQFAVVTTSLAMELAERYHYALRQLDR